MAAEPPSEPPSGPALARYRLDPPPVRLPEPPALWPEQLAGPDVDPAIARIRSLTETGALEAARSLARAEAARLGETTAAGRDALLALAVVESQLDPRTARAHYDRLLEAAQVAGGLLDPHLLAAYRGSGFLALAQEDYAAAEAALDTALQLHRRRYGLHDLAQSDLLAALIQLEILAGDVTAADQLQQRRRTLTERQLAADDPRRIALYEEMAETYRRLVLPAPMYDAHRRKREQQERQWGEDDPRLIPSLLDEARSGLLAVSMSEAGRPWDLSPLRRAEALALQIAPGETSLARANALIDVGDVYWLAQDSRRALRLYAQALESAPEVASRLAQPEVILWPGFEPLPGAADQAGRLHLRFTVNSRGRAIGIRVVSLRPAQDPLGLRRAQAWQQAISQAYFRPVIEDRRARSVSEVEFQDRFRPAS